MRPLDAPSWRAAPPTTRGEDPDAIDHPKRGELKRSTDDHLLFPLRPRQCEAGVPPLLLCRLPFVAVCAPDLALGDFGVELGDAELALRHVGKGRDFASSDVVELEHYRVRLAAVYTWVREEIIPQVPDVAGDVGTVALPLSTAAPLVPVTRILGLARPALSL